MKSFETAYEAMKWMAANAAGVVECYVWNTTIVIGGEPTPGRVNKWYSEFEWEFN